MIMQVEQVTDALILVFFGGALAYAGRVVRVRWWQSTLGRVTAYTAVVYVVVGSLAVAALTLGPNYPARPWVRLIAWAIIAPIPLSKLFTLAVAQARGELERLRSKGVDDHE